MSVEVVRWKVWKSLPVDLWWAMDKRCTNAWDRDCVCRSFNTWDDAMSYIKGFMSAQDSINTRMAQRLTEREATTMVVAHTYKGCCAISTGEDADCCCGGLWSCRCGWTNTRSDTTCQRCGSTPPLGYIYRGQA